MSTQIEFPGKNSDFLKIGVAAAAKGDVEKVRAILKARPKWVHHVGSHGRTMLWEASHKGRLKMVQYLVRRKADINACGSHYTPYFVDISCYCIARHKRHDEVADYLRAKGATNDIHTAAFLGKSDEVKAFLKTDRKLINQGHAQSKMADNDSVLDTVFIPSEWATPLCYALRGGDVETAKYLLSRKARVRGFEREMFIAAKGRVPLVRLLLEAGADATQMTDVLPDEKELADLLRVHGGTTASAQQINEKLVYLCRGDRGGNCEEVQRLITLGGDVNFQDHKGKTAVHRAAKAGFVQTLEVLFQNGAVANIADSKSNTALHDAVMSTIRDEQKKHQAIKLLLKNGADTRAENSTGKTPLNLVSQGRYSDTTLARLLRKREAEGQ